MSAGTSTVRRVLGYLVDRSPEILFLGGGANTLVAFTLYALPGWRTPLAFVAWSVVGTGLVFVSNYRSREEIAQGVEPRPWRTLVALQLLCVGAAWVLLSRR